MWEFENFEIWVCSENPTLKKTTKAKGIQRYTDYCKEAFRSGFKIADKSLSYSLLLLDWL
jgi:hypothetical protein